MWWPDGGSPRRRLCRVAGAALLGAAFLGGCGFHPLYGERTHEFDRDLATVQVDPIPERLGQLTALSLRDSFNPVNARIDYRYRLSVVMQAARADFAIRADGTASRQLYQVNAFWKLTAIGASEATSSGTARFSTSYDVGDNEYATIVAGQDAQKRAAREISEQIRTQLILFLRRQQAAQS
jgi:LPS-assembly lipoprotein